MRILVLYSRDVERIDAGGSRAVVQLIEYLAAKDDCTVYTNFTLIGENIAYTCANWLLDSESVLNKYVQDNHIDVIIIPEGRLYTSYARKAVKGTNCKIISALHSMPGYERIGIMTMLKESFHYNESRIKRLRAALFIALYPLVYIWYTLKHIFAFNRAYKDSDKLVLLSEKFFEEYKTKYYISDTSKFAAIGNAVSFNKCADDEDLKHKKKQLLFVGRFSEECKRISLILKAWELIYRKYPDWSLVLVGFGRSDKAYKDYVANHSLPRVSFEGKQKPESYYLNASIFLMTSAFEGWGMTLTEAQQMGCVPVAMHSFSSVTDIITDGENGFVVPNNDLNAFCERLTQLMDDKELLETMARNAVTSTERFSKEIVCEKYYKLCMQLSHSI